MNLDIFVCIHSRKFANKTVNFTRIYIHVFDIIAFIWHTINYFHDVHIMFADMHIMRNYVRREMSAFTVVPSFLFRSTSHEPFLRFRVTPK